MNLIEAESFGLATVRTSADNTARSERTDGMHEAAVDVGVFFLIRMH